MSHYFWKLKFSCTRVADFVCVNDTHRYLVYQSHFEETNEQQQLYGKSHLSSSVANYCMWCASLIYIMELFSFVELFFCTHRTVWKCRFSASIIFFYIDGCVSLCLSLLLEGCLQGQRSEFCNMVSSFLYIKRNISLLQILRSGRKCDYYFVLWEFLVSLHYVQLAVYLFNCREEQMERQRSRQRAGPWQGSRQRQR